MAVAAQHGESCGRRENLAARGAYGYIWGFIFPFRSDIRTLARTETDIPSCRRLILLSAGNAAEGRLLNLDPDFRPSLRREWTR